MKHINLILFSNVVLLILAIIGSTGCYILSNQLEELEEQNDYKAIILKAEKSNDVIWLRNGIKLLAEQRRSILQDKIQWYRNIGEFLTAFIAVSLVGIIYCFKLKKAMATNKSLSRIGADTAPPG